MRRLDLNAPATDHCIIGYVEFRPIDGETPRHEIPVYAYETVADPLCDTVNMSGAQADALTDAALIAYLVDALHHIKHGMSMTAVQVIAIGAIAKARACGHG